MARGANTGAEPSPSCTLPWLWVAASRTTYPTERRARGANTGAEPSPSCTMPWLWVAASRTTFSPERMARGANTGAEPSPSCTLPWLWVAASRTTFSPERIARDANTWAPPSPSCTMPWLLVPAARAACVAKLVHARGDTDQNGKPTRNSPACAARPAVGDALRADEDRARDHPAGYLGCGARRIGGGGALDHCALHGLQDPGAAGFCRRAVCTRLCRVRDSVRAHRNRA